jgi:hypothetical protein
MAIDFPASPTLNDVFTVGNVTYVWDGTKWTASVTGGISLDKIEEGNTSAEVIDTGSDGRFVVTTEGTERLRVINTGNVGIGTTSPGYPLHVFSSTSTVGIRVDGGGDSIVSFANAGSAVGAVGIAAGNIAGGGSGNIGIQSGSSLLFATGGVNEKARIDSSGRLGIGTSSPGQKLHIAGLGATALAVQTNSANNNAALHFLNSSGTIKTAFTCDTDTGAEKFYLSHNGVDALVIDSSQRVGIGTTSPQGKLEVSNTAEAPTIRLTRPGSADFEFYASSETFILTDKRNSSERLRIDSSGRLGIGTSSPSALLELGGSVALGSTRAIYARYPGDSASSARTAFEITANESGTEKATFRVMGDGSIQGNSYAGTVFRNSSGDEIARFDTSNRLGIGATPAAWDTDDGLEAIQLNSYGALWNYYNNVQLAFNTYQSSTGDKYLTADEAAKYTLDSGGNHVWYTASSGSANAAVTFSERARIDNSGRLLVGTSSASQVSTLLLQGRGSATGAAIARLCTTNAAPADGDALGIVAFSDSGHTTAAQISVVRDGGTWTSGTSQPTRLEFSTTANGASSPTERMRIDSAGNVTFRTGTTPDRNGSGTAFVDSSGSGSPVYLYFKKTFNGSRDAIDFNHNGTSVGVIQFTNTATSYATSSDYRLKENVTPVTDGITRLQQLKPARFNFIADPDKTVDGFLAHEVQDIVPEAITGEKDAVDEDGNPKYQGIDQSKLVPLLTAALQEAVAKIETLEGMVAVNNITIDEQQHQLSTLAARLTALESA